MSRLRDLARALGLASAPFAHRRFLLELLPKNSIGAEIGVHVGDFAHEILRVVRPAKLHLIDPWKFEPAETYHDAVYGGGAERGQKEMDERHAAVVTRFDEEIRAGIVRVHRGYSADVLRNFPDDHLDWVYIDGNHLYEFVAADLELSFRKVKRGGYITGDDYREGGWWEGGVKRAVDEFVAREAVQVIALRERQFVLRK